MSEFRPRTWPTSYAAGRADPQSAHTAPAGDLAGILGPIMTGFPISWHGFLAALILSVPANLVAALIFAAAARETVPRGQR
jgi:hypothetical protein